MPDKAKIYARMQSLAERIGYNYRNLSHLSCAMYCKKEAGKANYTNDAMATLGDAVLDLVWSEYFFAAGLDKEAEQILSKIPKGAWFCILTPEGKMLSSEELAEQIRDVKLSGKSSACFLIGSSFGISPKIKQIADFKLSMSKMTFPHHLARIMVLEQLYRAEAIQAGSKYHK